MTSKVKATKSKNRQAGLDKNLTFFCASKDTISRLKRQSMEWEKIFTNHLCDKEYPEYMWLPWWLSGKEFPCRFRRHKGHRFDP